MDIQVLTGYFQEYGVIALFYNRFFRVSKLTRVSGGNHIATGRDFCKKRKYRLFAGILAISACWVIWKSAAILFGKT